MDLSPIPLPYGKTYHLFLSFCQEDEEIAFSLLQELENKYQLKCFYHLRDFKPGVHVTENILNGIEKSMKIISCPRNLKKVTCAKWKLYTESRRHINSARTA